MTNLNQHEIDYLDCYQAFSNYMFEEAAEIGWNACRSRETSKRYSLLSTLYEDTYKEPFLESPQLAAELYAKRSAA